MNDCVTCNLCDAPGTFEEAVDVARVPCNTRRHRDEIFTVWRCRNCGSLHCKEAVALDGYYRDYYLRNQVLDYFNRCSYRNRVRLLRKAGVGKRHRVLDYGCGHGLFVSYLQERGYSAACGYDPYEPEYAAETTLAGRYEAITLYDVIEHVDDPRALLGQLSRLLCAGGILCVHTPSGGNIDLSQPGTPELHQPYHRHLLSETALVKLGEQAGLTPLFVHRRSFLDTLFPAVNARFIWEYMRRYGNVFDVLMEPPRVGSVLTSPRLLFFAVAGYFFPPRQSMLVSFRRQSRRPPGRAVENGTAAAGR